MAQEQTTELLSCPFCGSPGEVINKGNVGAYVAQCSNYMCHLSPRTRVYGSRKKVVKQWNTRTPSEDNRNA